MTRPHFPPATLALLLAAFLLCLAVPARAAEVVWSGLVYATNQDAPAELPRGLPKELDGFATRLQRVFGYNHFELLSDHRELMDKKAEGWLLPGKGFYLRVDATESATKSATEYPAKSATESAAIGFSMNLQLYQEKRLIVQTQATLARQSPIFVRGPQCENGQLIIVLLVK